MATYVSSRQSESLESRLLKTLLQRLFRAEALLKTFLQSSHDSPLGADSKTQFWAGYVKAATKHDNELVDKYKNDMDIVILFATLFSAVVAAFLVAAQPGLSPNPVDTTNALLTLLIQKIDNSTSPVVIPSLPGPARTVVYSQALGYASLSCGLLAALGAVLGKHWISTYSYFGPGTDEQRGQRRQQKLDSLAEWHFDFVMEGLPALLQLALAFFLASQCINQLATNKVVGWTFVSITLLGGFVYFLLTALSLWNSTCPFPTPVSVVIQRLVHSVAEVARYWEHERNSRSPDLKPPMITPSTMLLFTVAVFLLPAFLIFYIPILILIWTWWLVSGTMPHRLERIITSPKSSLLGQICDIADSFLQEPQPSSDVHSAAWILETSNLHDAVPAAVILASHKEWPRSFDHLLPTQRLCDVFIRSISEMLSARDIFQDNRRDCAFALGKALVTALSQSSELADHYHWDGALRAFRQFPVEKMNPEFAFLFTVIAKLLPIEGDLRTDFKIQTLCISDDLLGWMLELLRQKLGVVWFTEVTGSRRAYYLQASIPYLEILADHPGSTTLPSGDDWNTVRRILFYMRDPRNPFSDEEGQCLQQCVDLCGRLLRAHPAGRGLIDNAVHSWVLDITTLAAHRDASDLIRSLASSALDLVIVVPDHRVSRGDNSDILAYLDRQLPSNDAQTCYLLRSILGSDSTSRQHVVFQPEFSHYLVQYPQPSPVQQICLEIIATTFESLPPASSSDEAKGLQSLVSNIEFIRYILGVIQVKESPLRDAGLRVLHSFLEYLLLSGNEGLREQWQIGLSPAIHAGAPGAFATFPLDYNDPVFSNPKSHFIRILCALGNDEDQNRLSGYWDFMTPRDPPSLSDTEVLKAAKIAGVAHWVLNHCDRARPWYLTLENNFQAILRVAWGNPDVFTENPEYVHSLVACTAEWLKTHAQALDPNISVILTNSVGHQVLQGLHLKKEAREALDRIMRVLQVDNIQRPAQFDVDPEVDNIERRAQLDVDLEVDYMPLTQGLQMMEVQWEGIPQFEGDG